jgi:protein phosphatase
VTGHTTPQGEVLVHVFGRTDVGRTREHNEDTFAVADLTTMNASLQPEVRTHRVGPRGSLFLVADGMGGAAAGEVASAMAAEVILSEVERRWSSSSSDDPEIFAHALRAATEVANTKIHAYASSNPENRGMGTTATIAGFLGDTLYVCQVGDSRAYLVRDGVASQITKDQSLMQKLVEAGELTAEEAEISERRNIILQALGPEPVVRVDLTSQQVKRGDVLVLCSDGLSGQVRAREIVEVVNSEPDLVAVCKRLIDLANENGGPDNITVVAARFEGPGLSETMAETVAHRVYRGSQEQRATVPVERDSIPISAVEEPDPSTVPTLETTPAARPAPRMSPRGSAPKPAFQPAKGTAEIAPAAVRAKLPPAPPAGGRMDRGALRFVFGTIAVLLLGYYLVTWLRS